MQMRVDEARNRDQAAPVDLARAPVAVVSADDAVAADGNIGLGHCSGDDVEQPDVLDDEISRRSSQALIDRPFQECPLHHDAT